MDPHAKGGHTHNAVIITHAGVIEVTTTQVYWDPAWKSCIFRASFFSCKLMALTSETMTEICLHLDCFDEERKLYSAESLNDLHKMNVCSDPKDLLKLTEQPMSSQTTPTAGERSDCLGGVTQLVNVHSAVGIEEERIKTLHTSDVEEGSKTSHTHPRPRLFLILFILPTLALLLILVLSAYTVLLMVETASRMGELAGVSEVERTYQEEMRQWKTLLQQYLDLSQNHCS
ncbi:uncharacterized protein LOC135563968 [Oncorhynchus nerka]|uniref:uncharacterized protein LOC135563968 n=1 Tax=Oncorhynchus nerka TaxID=8023 RepID=UPI0031B83788